MNHSTSFAEAAPSMGGALPPLCSQKPADCRAVVGQIAATGLQISDLLAFSVAVGLSRLLAPEGWGLGQPQVMDELTIVRSNWHIWITALLLVAVLGSFHFLGHYTRRVPVLRETSQIITTVMIALFAMNIAKAALDGAPLRLWMMLAWVAFVPMALVGRGITRAMLCRAGQWQVRTLIIGEPGIAEEVRLALHSERGLGYEVTASLPSSRFIDAAAGKLGTHGLVEAMREHGATFVVVVVGGADTETERELVLTLDRAHLPYAVVPHTRALPVIGVDQQYFFGHDVLLLSPGNNLARPFSRAVKAMFDVVLASLLLLVLTPTLLLVALLVHADGGPVLFAHERIGVNNRRFPCLKFRTMVVDAERRLRELLASDPAAAAEWAETQKLRKDPRITRVGNILRRTSLDELPQLFNVLRGEMSLVGPRPIVEAELCRYADNAAYYAETRPGITGLWQVSGRSETSYEYRVRLDVWYVRNWSLWHDIAILLKTVPAVLMRRGSV